jgi:hypothetical protein
MQKGLGPSRQGREDAGCGSLRKEPAGILCHSDDYREL